MRVTDHTEPSRRAPEPSRRAPEPLAAVGHALADLQRASDVLRTALHQRVGSRRILGAANGLASAWLAALAALRVLEACGTEGHGRTRGVWARDARCVLRDALGVMLGLLALAARQVDVPALQDVLCDVCDRITIAMALDEHIETLSPVSHRAATPNDLGSRKDRMSQDSDTLGGEPARPQLVTGGTIDTCKEGHGALRVVRDDEIPPSRSPLRDDDVVRLREWGTERFYNLPEPPVRDCFIGRSNACALQLADPRVSPRHAELLHEWEQWHLRDLQRSLGLRRDGERCNDLVLTPGVEVGIGTTTLIAESPRSIALRAFCARILGWGDDRMPVVDHALRAIRLAQAQRVALVLRGDGDMVPIAHALHRRVLGDEAPFIVCDPRRREGSPSMRSPVNHTSGVLAYRAAIGGSLCVRDSRLPHDRSLLLELLRKNQSHVLVIVCTDGKERGCVLTAPSPIEVPPLCGRGEELSRIVDEYANDAILALRPPRPPAVYFADHDRGWVMEHARTHSDIEKGVLRIVARNMSGNCARAATLLGMSQPALRDWIARRDPAWPVSGRQRMQSELEALAQRFIGFVRANPGLRIEQINKQLGTATYDLTYLIRRLKADGVIYTKGHFRVTCYFAAEIPG